MDKQKLIIVSLIKTVWVLIYTAQKQEIKYQKKSKSILLRMKNIINLTIMHLLILIEIFFALFKSFSLYFTINGFFFDDSTMHKVTESNGKYDIIYQIPQILYSSVVSAVINMILKRLSLSEKNILLIKQEKNMNLAIKKSKSIEKSLSIKFLIFFWYFISCFCAVYINTQIILIEDILFSFGLSMLFPFGLNLLPGFFSIPALRAKNKNKKCLYKISGLIALI